MKRTFEIEFPDLCGPMWMNKDNLMLCLNAYCNTTGVSVSDVTDSLADKEAELAQEKSLRASDIKIAVDHAMSEKEAELVDLREKVLPLLDWIEIKTQPNERYNYSRCVICGATWWYQEENHNISCFVPALRAAFTK